MTELYLLPLGSWLRSLVLAGAILGDPQRDVYFADSSEPDFEAATIGMLRERMPLYIIDATGCVGLEAALTKAGMRFCKDIACESPDLAFLTAQFGAPKGLCFALDSSPADCLKAAVVAVRMGWYFLPLKEDGELPAGIPEQVPCYLVGPASRTAAIMAQAGSAALQWLQTDEDLAALFASAGLDTGYLVVYNSADLAAETKRGDCLGSLKVGNLSLLITLLAAYRPVFPFDAASEQPDSLVIEESLHRTVRAVGIAPRFLTVLASPGYVPFIYEEKKAIGAVTEEMVRDIHLRLNRDLFFDLAEGRLFQHTVGGLSAQLISTRRYHEACKKGGGGKDVLIVSTPHVESGIIFSTDEALIEAQLMPLLQEAGCEIKLLQDREAHYAAVGEALSAADLFLFSGHGGPEGLHLHGRNLNRNDLPNLPPLVAYASACSTVGLVPHWYSPDEGLQWEGVPVDSREVIGLSFVEKGALCFVGGATIEDLQYTTSTYSVFMEALLVKGLSVGEAVREMRHVISLYAATLAQKNPEAYRKYRWSTANAIHQQVLIGDPAFTPVPQKHEGSAFPCRIAEEETCLRLSVEIPEERWRQSRAAIREREESSCYYRCRQVEAITPYGEDVISWGDYYRIAPDGKDMSEKALKSSFVRLTLELPPGRVPRSLKLVAAHAGKSECLLCGGETEHFTASIEEMSNFKLPYLLQPPIALDMREGWAYVTAFNGNRLTVHWLAPLLLFDEKTRSAFRLNSFTFELKTAPGSLIVGKVVPLKNKRELLISAGEAHLETIGAPASKAHFDKVDIQADRAHSEAVEIHAGKMQPEMTGMQADKAHSEAGVVLAGEAKPKTVGAAFPVTRSASGDDREQPETTTNKLRQGLKTVYSQVLCEPDGRFVLPCPAGSAIQVQDQFPLYLLLEDYSPMRDSVFLPAGGEIEVAPLSPGTVPFTGYLYDSYDGKPLVGALVRIFRGEMDPVGDPLIEAYAGEALTGQQGEFFFSLPHGGYILYAAASTGDRAYKSGQWNLKLPEMGELRQVFSLDRAARVTGTVRFQGYRPPDPPTVALKRFPRVRGEGVLTRVPVRKDGSFECLVGFRERFMIILEEEGWLPINDTNSGQGYRLGPGETLERRYRLIPDGDVR